MDLSELVSTADPVVHTRTVASRVRRNVTGSQIFTDTEFEILDDAKGTDPKRLTIFQLGGQIDPVDMTVEGTRGFIVGEEVVLFTEERAGGGRQIVGLSQGVARVPTDPATGDTIAAGFDTWQNDPDSTMTFTYGGTTPVSNPGADGTNAVLFCGSTVFSTGTLARTVSTALMVPVDLGAPVALS